MTPDRLREILTLLRWTQRGLAEALTCDERLARRWASGAASVPLQVAEWLETLAATHKAHPPPQGWRTRG